MIGINRGIRLETVKSQGACFGRLLTYLLARIQLEDASSVREGRPRMWRQQKIGGDEFRLLVIVQCQNGPTLIQSVEGFPISIYLCVKQRK